MSARPLTVAQLRAALATMPDDIEVWAEGCDCTRGVYAASIDDGHDLYLNDPHPLPQNVALLQTDPYGDDEGDEETP